MGFALAIGNCVVCTKIFDFNPHLVPSLRGNLSAEGKLQLDPDGARLPICNSCMQIINEELERHGIEPFRIPPGAYEAEEI